MATIKSRKKLQPEAPWPFESDNTPAPPSGTNTTDPVWPTWPFPTNRGKPLDPQDEEVLRKTTLDVDVHWFEVGA